MSDLVIDASIAIKWVIEEDRTKEALALRRQALAAPDLLVAECANILRKKVRRKELWSRRRRSLRVFWREPTSSSSQCGLISRPLPGLPQGSTILPMTAFTSLSPKPKVSALLPPTRLSCARRRDATLVACSG